MDVNAVGDWMWHSLVRLADVAPLGTFVAAVVAVIALGQKFRTDRRQAWWERLRWATDTALKDDEHSRRVGTAAVKAVQAYKHVTPEDQPLLGAIGDEVLDEETTGLVIIGPIGGGAGVDDSPPEDDNEEIEGGTRHAD